MKKHFFHNVRHQLDDAFDEESMENSVQTGLADNQCDSARVPIKQVIKLCRRRPCASFSGASTNESVRRWNSFHATRGEYHPNKIRRERKSTSGCLESRRTSTSSPLLSPTISRLGTTRELRRGKSLAEKSSKLSTDLHKLSPSCSSTRRNSSSCFGRRSTASSVFSHDVASPTLHPYTLDVDNEMAMIDAVADKHYITASGSSIISHKYPSPSSQMDDYHPLNRFHSGRHSIALNEDSLKHNNNRGSHSSDTSSAYSGSDTMTSIYSSSIDADEIDLTGLLESAVDSDDEDLPESLDSLVIRDTVRECLEKNPADRSVYDVDVLLEFTHKLKAFTNLTLEIRRALCSVMIFAVIPRSGTVVLSEGEELDSWSVLINGLVEIEYRTGEKEDLHVGDAFGILPVMEKFYHKGVMRTKANDCQFVCITQPDYYRIHNQGAENIVKHEEDGQVVMITELRSLNSHHQKREHVVIKATDHRLILQLMDDKSIDSTFVEDFLLTYRTFIHDPFEVAEKLLKWFECGIDPDSHIIASHSEIKDRITRVVLLWVNNHFMDFELNGKMMEFLEKFELQLEQSEMFGQLRLLHIACAAKARIRSITLARSDRSEDLNFSIVSGNENGQDKMGIFVSYVTKDTKAEEIGLKRGDQILEVNGQKFDTITYNKAYEILCGATHLSLVVKSNLLAYKEMLQNEYRYKNSANNQNNRRKTMNEIRQGKLNDGNSISNLDMTSLCINEKKDGSVGTVNTKHNFITSAPKKCLQKALIRMNILPKINTTEDVTDATDDSCLLSPISTSTRSKLEKQSTFSHSLSNPDLSSTFHDDVRMNSEYPENVLKIYKSDQSCKYILIHNETMAKDVVALAMHEFGIQDCAAKYSLCEVSVGEGGLVKQRRLPDQLDNLAERIGLASRYYLKTNGVSENLVPDEMATEIVRENIVHFLALNANELATQLTFQDFAIFRQIEASDYVEDLFELRGIVFDESTPLFRFSELVNKEMFWVVTEVCSESNVVRRMKIIKQFIKIARHCKECKNFNSMFAIISGLAHNAVSRLKLTWDKLPTKYQKLFNDLQEYMDPSRNMSKYRQLIAMELSGHHPIIPFYPIVKKDLTFIHLGNDTHIDNLINFEKLRMIAKEIRNLANMCSSPYDLLAMFESRGHQLSTAMVAMNQMSVLSAGQHHFTIKRRKKSALIPNPKRMFEEAQMLRRVKAYLNNIKVITDEEVLYNMSQECEANTSSTPSSLAIRKRHPSPTLSTTSSTSSTSEGKKGCISTPKFVSASPQSGKKSLHIPIEGAKNRFCHTKHPGIILSGLLQTSSQNSSPNLHRRTESSNSAGSVPFLTYSTCPNSTSNGGIRSIHERSHSDTPTPVLSIDVNFDQNLSTKTELKALPHVFSSRGPPLNSLFNQARANQVVKGLQKIGRAHSHEGVTSTLSTKGEAEDIDIPSVSQEQ